MTARRWVGSGAAVFLLVATWHRIGSGVTPGDPTVRPGATPRSPASPDLRPLGAGSCSAAACHGSAQPADPILFPSRVLRNEHTIWITQDRHANAYQVLTSARSQRMVALLPGNKGVPAHEDARCLVCHSTTGTNPLVASPEVVRQDGVGCESCHGPAELWLGAHTQSWWNGLSVSDKETRFGMHPTKALEKRAAMCAECHVGSPGLEVDHDLIAAGHPRLNFEFAAFLANLPPHWVEDTRGNFPARAWAIGQVETARAALDQLHARADRARAAKEKHVASRWPEFSEYDCFSCHHELADEKWRKSSKGPGLAPGTPPWGTWYYPASLALAVGDQGAGARDLDARFSALRAEMGRFAADPAKVAGAAGALSAALGRRLASLPEETKAYDAVRIKGLIKAVEAGAAPGGWDAAAQRYLALQPLRQALIGLDPAGDDGRLRAELETWFGQLKFPRGFDSPRGFDPASRRGER
jgi:hypothetical protein